MLKSERMTKIRIITSKTKQGKVVRKLHDLKVLHIIEHKKNEDLDIGIPEKDAERIAGLLVMVKAMVSEAHGKISAASTASEKIKKIKNTDNTWNIEEIEKKTEYIENYIKNRIDKINELDKKIISNRETLQKLGILNLLYLNLESYYPLKSVACFVGTIKKKDGLKEDITKITSKFKLHTSNSKTDDAVALFVERRKEQEVTEMLRARGFSEINLDMVEGKKGTPLKHINEIEDVTKKFEESKKRIENEINAIREKNYPLLKSYENHLSIEAEKAEAPLRFGQTSDAVIIKGWVPASKEEEIIKDINTITNNKIIVERIDLEKKESVPVKLKNNMLVRPFEFFMRLYTLPSYKEIDPSTLIFLTFPLFFGFMLGDVGYGLITLILFITLMKIIPAGKDLLKAMMVCSIWSIIFGLMFGEYFGFEKLEMHGIIYEFPRIINRLHGEINVMGNEIPSVLVIGAIVGIIHINLSILIGFINEYKNHGLKEAILAKLSWYVFEAGIIVIALNALQMIALPENIMPYTTYIGAGLILLSIIMIYLGEGVQGIVEIPAIFSNTLSYLRLGAVGLASVGLAVVVNEKLAIPFIEKGGIYIAVAVLILIVGHAINIALGIIGPFLHAIRLHYVEFFSRFYKGGGKEYKPFGMVKEE